jgi:hypothetical protein
MHCVCNNPTVRTLAWYTLTNGVLVLHYNARNMRGFTLQLGGVPPFAHVPAYTLRSATGRQVLYLFSL